MEGSIHRLPPSKRFKLLQQQEDTELSDPHPPNCLPVKKRIDSHPLPASACLPAKKRVWAPHFHHLPGSVCLPAKKRVWAPHPLSPPKPQEDTQPIKENPESKQQDGKEVEEEEEDDGIICAVCQSTDGDPVDPIVFCDGCDLMAHASCYGNPLMQSIPEGNWFCVRCEREGAEKEKSANCCLCPIKGGAVKPTIDGRWAHIVCALLVPEVFFRDPEGRDGIDCSRVPVQKRKAACYLCGSDSGCAIECSEPKCGLGFHVSCGLTEGLCIEYKEGRGGGIVAGFCRDHTQLWKKQQPTGKFRIVPRENDSKRKGRN